MTAAAPWCASGYSASSDTPDTTSVVTSAATGLRATNQPPATTPATPAAPATKSAGDRLDVAKPLASVKNNVTYVCATKIATTPTALANSTTRYARRSGREATARVSA